MLPFPTDRSSISSLAGTLSFVIWLFAQTPQIIKNHHRQSVDGLSLVFLFQWIAGDVLNLVGCLLTGQLFFQVAVACWFVAVDVVLSWQVFLYTHLRPRREVARPRRKRHHDYGSSTVKSRHHDYGTSTVKSRHHDGYATSTVRSRHHDGHHTPTVKPIDQWYYDRARRSTSRRISQRDHRRSQSYTARGRPKAQHRVDMSASMNLDEQRREELRREPGQKVMEEVGQPSRPPLNVRPGQASSSSSSASSSHSEAEEEDDRPRGRPRKRPMGVRIATSALPPLSRSSSTSSYRQMTQEAIRVLRIVERLEGRRGSTRSGMTSPEDSDTGDYFFRGRATSRSAGATPRANPTSLASSVASSRSASRVPRGVRRHARLDAILLEEGRANGESDITIREAQPTRGVTSHTGLLLLGGVVGLVTLCGLLAYLSSRSAAWVMTLTTPPETTQVLGRLSSWLCTILYVTSRLPQIWENQTRRSCEGISILLFVAAFLGNLFYAISILSNPQSGQWLGGGGPDEPPLPDDPWMFDVNGDEEARRYLMESMPFLLGSAGTLFFDAVVLAQWWVFGVRDEGLPVVRPHSHSHTETTPLLGHDESR